jgi:hypothetical protein
MSGNQPSGIVVLPEGQKGLPQLLNGLEPMHPQEVLLQGTDEPFRTAIAFPAPARKRANSRSRESAVHPGTPVTCIGCHDRGGPTGLRRFPWQNHRSARTRPSAAAREPQSACRGGWHGGRRTRHCSDPPPRTQQPVLRRSRQWSCQWPTGCRWFPE